MLVWAIPANACTYEARNISGIRRLQEGLGLLSVMLSPLGGILHPGASEGGGR